MASVHDELKALVRTIRDFPKPGIQFRDITTLLLDRTGLAAAVDGLAATVEERDPAAEDGPRAGWVPPCSQRL